MTFDLSTVSTLVAILVPTIGAIVWAVRLEGRLNVHEARQEAVISRLVRIERKIDDLNGHVSH